MIKRTLYVLTGCLVLSSCVSMKKYNDLKADAIRFDSQCSIANEQIATLNGEVGSLKNKVSGLEATLESLTAERDQLKKTIKEGQEKYNRLVTEGSAEAGRMLKQLEENQARLAEMEAMLKNREEAIHQIRRKVADALLGFEGKGLTVKQIDGKVYVSMDDKLLFKSGSFDIDPNGAKAVKELGNVLALNPDINIVVEGHTDNVPYKSNGQIKDNLDLSVKRATTVTRLLLENKDIAPERIISSGRGEYLPLETADTREARQRNRRTEIILTPKLDELMKLMEKK